MDNPADTTPPAAPVRRPVASVFITLVIFAASGLLLARMIMGGATAETPEFMPVTTSLSSVSFEAGTPVVAVVTADWCGPCQELKRTTLREDRVRAVLTDRSQPVMIDGTDTQVAMPTLEQLGVRAFPSTVILRDGKPVAMLEGYANADKYLAWLEEHL